MTDVDTKRNRKRIYYQKLDGLFQMRMERGETINSFRARVKSQFSLIKSISGGGIFQPDFSANPSLNFLYDDELEEKFLCIFIIYRSNQAVFGERIRTYEQYDEDGSDIFPTKEGDLMSIWINQFNRMNNGRTERQFFTPHLNKNRPRDADGYRGSRTGCILCDVEVADIVKGTNQEIWTVKCDKCEKWGYNRRYCPTISENNPLSKTSLLSYLVLSQHRKIYNFDPYHYYIDSGANFSSTFDSNIIDTIQFSRPHDSITVVTNAGSIRFDD